MKRALIVLLACANVALLLALLLANTPRANAQAARGQADYLTVTARSGGDNQGIFIIDMSRQRLLGWNVDKTNKRLVQWAGRELVRDFPAQTPTR